MTALPQGTRRAAILVSGRQIASRERLFLRVARQLAERDWHVTILAAAPEPALRQAVTAPLDLADIAPRWTGRGGLNLPHLARIYLSVPGLARYLRQNRPDLLFATSIPPNLIAAAACRLAGGATRLVLRHSNAPSGPVGGARPRLRDRLVPLLYPRADAVIAVARDMAATLIRNARLDPSRLAVIPNGIDLDGIEALAVQPPGHPWLADDGPPVILAVGRLAPQKDYPTLLAAFARLRSRRAARLLILGDGPERGRIDRLCRRLGIAASVALPGHTANPFPAMARARLFVLSSRWEGMPSVLLEALACGSPVVSTACPTGPDEILRDADGQWGLLVPPGNAEMLADAMDRGLDQPVDRARQQARAACFALDPIASRYVGILTGEPS